MAVAGGEDAGRRIEIRIDHLSGVAPALTEVPAEADPAGTPMRISATCLAAPSRRPRTYRRT